MNINNFLLEQIPNKEIVAYLNAKELSCWACVCKTTKQASTNEWQQRMWEWTDFLKKIEGGSFYPTLGCRIIKRWEETLKEMQEEGTFGIFHSIRRLSFFSRLFWDYLEDKKINLPSKGKQPHLMSDASCLNYFTPPKKNLSTKEWRLSTNEWGSLFKLYAPFFFKETIEKVRIEFSRLNLYVEGEKSSLEARLKATRQPLAGTLWLDVDEERILLLFLDTKEQIKTIECEVYYIYPSSDHPQEWRSRSLFSIYSDCFEKHEIHPLLEIEKKQ